MVECAILSFRGSSIDKIQLLGLETIICRAELSSETERKSLIQQILELIYKYFGKTLIYDEEYEDLMLFIVKDGCNGRVLQVLHYDTSRNTYGLLTLPYVDSTDSLNRCPIKIRFIINSPYK